MSPTRLSRLENAMRVILEFNDAFNRHGVLGMMKLMSDDCIFENTYPAPDGTTFLGKDTVRLEVEANQEIIRSALREAELIAAQDKGRAMTLGQALGFASDEQ